VITADREREFYDGHYGKFLSLPDDALRVDRAVLERNLEDPSHPSYERRRLYRAVIRELECEPLKGRRVLDYGSGPADFGIWMAIEGADVTLLDISPAAIEVGLRRARSSAVEIRGIAANAVHLPMLSDGEFDLVFACAALHHTLKYPGAVEELARVIKPGGRLVLCETWGGNPFLGLARRVRASMAAEPEAQGEAIILSGAKLRLLHPFFNDIEIDFVNLLAMAKRCFRGSFKRDYVRAFLDFLERLDAGILAIFPAMRPWCGEAVITARRR